jgi:hypothetical protein
VRETLAPTRRARRGVGARRSLKRIEKRRVVECVGCFSDVFHSDAIDDAALKIMGLLSRRLDGPCRETFQTTRRARRTRRIPMRFNALHEVDMRQVRQVTSE